VVYNSRSITYLFMYFIDSCNSTNRLNHARRVKETDTNKYFAKRYSCYKVVTDIVRHKIVDLSWTVKLS